MRILEDWHRSLRLKKGLQELNDIKGWRSYTLDLLLLLSLVALPLGFLATFPHYISMGNYTIVVFDTLIFFLLLASYFNYDPFPQGVSFFVLLYTLVIFFFVVNGPFYGRPGWLVLCTVIASLLFGVRGAVATSLAGALFLSIMFWVVGPHLSEWAPIYTEPTSKWIMFTVNLTLISLAAGLPVSMLLNRLSISFTQGRDLRGRLLEEGEALKAMNASLQEEIAERRRMESELRVSEEKYRGLFDDALVGIFHTTPEGRFLVLNRYFARMFGYDSPEEMMESVNNVGSQLYSNREERAKLVRYLEKHGSYEGYGSPALCKDGSLKWIMLKIHVVRGEDGGVHHYEGTALDLTEQKEAERALRKSEESMRRITENMLDLLCEVDAKGRFGYISPSFHRTLGYKPEDLVGERVFARIHPDDLELVMNEYREGLSSGSVREAEYRIRHADGHYIWLRSTGNPLFDDQGRFAGAVVTGRDITDRKKAEEEKKALEHQLIQSQKMESMGTLAGGIAHDFNNILSAIIGYAELSKLHIPLDSQSYVYVDQVLSAGIRAKGLVQQILSFSRHSMQEMKPVMVGAVAKEALHLLRATIPSTIEIRQDVEDEGFVLSDPVKVHQIMMNLCTNAAHAMEKDGGVLSVGLCRERVAGDAQSHVLGVPAGDYLRLTVSDTGHGMTPEIMEKIFDPYFTTKDRGRGTGLGLAVIHSIVQSHRGAIRCTSMPGKGTTFEVYLPEVRGEGHPAEPPRETRPSAGTERVLFVDDEEALADVGKMMLESLGYTVTAMTSPLEALRIFRQDPAAFDLVMTDMTMPGMTGDLLARKVMEIRADAPVILCTGYSERMSPEQAHLMGIREFVMKPLEFKTLSQILRKVLDNVA